MINKLALLLTRNWPFVRGRHFLFRKYTDMGMVASISAKIGNECQSRSGFWITCLANDRVSDWLKVFGNYEVGTDKTLLEMSSSGDGRFLDIGANVGYYSLLLASANPQLNVWAFEPNSSPRTALEKSVERNNLKNQVKVFPVALSDHDGEMSFSVEEGISGSGHLTADNESDSKVTVRQFRRLWTEEGSPKIRCVKLDVEGHEFQVLCAMREMLERDRPALVVELVEDQLARSGSSVKEVKELLAGLGYVEQGGFELNTFFKVPKLER